MERSRSEILKRRKSPSSALVRVQEHHGVVDDSGHIGIVGIDPRNAVVLAPPSSLALRIATRSELYLVDRRVERAFFSQCGDDFFIPYGLARGERGFETLRQQEFDFFDKSAFNHRIDAFVDAALQKLGSTANPTKTAGTN